MKAVQSIERAFAILDVLAAEPCGISETARRVELPKSTVARLMATLEAVGGVERVGEVYRVGSTIGGLASSVLGTLGLIGLARPYLQQLAQAIDEAAGLSVAEGNRMHTIVQVDVDRSVQARDWTGETALIHSVPAGLAMMADWPEDRLSRFLDHPLEHSTPKTLVQAAAIRERLALIQDQGYAWGKEEFVEGINSVAAPLRDGSGTAVAGIHVHGPAFRFPQPGSEEEIGRGVANTAERLSRAYRATAS